MQDVRESHGVLQSELCEATGLTKNHISAVERGVSKASIRMLLGYCEKIGITPTDILGYSEFNLMTLTKYVAVLCSYYTRFFMMLSFVLFGAREYFIN